jgi:hypothetical protein
MRNSLLVFAAAALAACAGIVPTPTRARGDLDARVAALLARQGLGTDALAVIDNVVRHEAAPPPAAQPLVRELLADPLAATDVATLFRRLVPSELARFAENAEPPPARAFDELVASYVEELALAQRDLRAATAAARFDDAAVIRSLAQGELPLDALIAASSAIDAAALERANLRFIEATARFARALRSATGLPSAPRRFDSPIGLVVVGTAGPDRYGPEAALIIDPGGDDVYERAPVAAGGVSVIVDLGGNDRYTGSDLALRGLSAIVDFAGDDRYEMDGPGLGAAIAGVSLLVDYAGNDSYRASFFGEAAAAFGIGALLDLGGDDRYRLTAFGQAFGLAGGLALLWDRAGDDRYAASGAPDPFGRSARISAVQGAAMGFRTMLGGGAAILRDDAGNDAYEAEMFAQGNGYYYGLGILWDRGGDDRYRAARYAQGNGVHQAVGVLRDEAGNDDYAVAWGAAQGMGLDLALGVLFDASGDDRYVASAYAQATGTANGIGLLVDGGGADRWQTDGDPRTWGQAEWYRRLPTVGLLVRERGRGRFVVPGKELAEPPPPARLAEAPASPDCAPGARPPSRAELAALRPDHFDAVLEMGERLRCAPPWDELARLLDEDPSTPLALAIALALRERPPAPARREALLRRLGEHPRCSVRAAALVAQQSVAAAKAALGSSCYLMQAAALESLERLGARPATEAALPSFLRK